MTTSRRLNHIFRADGRALIVAMDHGLFNGPSPGLERPADTIAQVVAGGADAILTSYGIARRFAKELASIGLILRIDGMSTSLKSESGPSALIHSVEEAIRLDADAVAVNGFPGGVHEEASLENVAQAARTAHAWGVALMAEMVPGGFDSPPEARTQEAVALGARVGAELGADFIKTNYTSGFEQVTGGCYVPVVILGGSKRGSEQAMLADIKAAVSAGGAGVAIGRNIFQAEDPAAMTAAVAAILHQDASVEEAMTILSGAER